MTRRANHQFLTFWFSLNNLPTAQDPNSPEQEAAVEALYPVWKKACAQIEARQDAHPLYRFQENFGGDMLDFENWEFCEQDALVEDVDGMVAWPVAFYHTKPMEPAVIAVLRDVCLAGFKTICDGAGIPGNLLKIETSTEYLETVTETVTLN
jgi:NAD(P)H-dependent flavin oxidoreductase YrpB (nitropropane dioxygenase family)